jgi:hypothetical protein
MAFWIRLVDEGVGMTIRCEVLKGSSTCDGVVDMVAVKRCILLFFPFLTVHTFKVRAYKKLWHNAVRIVLESEQRIGAYLGVFLLLPTLFILSYVAAREIYIANIV